jgi:hypothetical protein
MAAAAVSRTQGTVVPSWVWIAIAVVVAVIVVLWMYR